MLTFLATTIQNSYPPTSDYNQIQIQNWNVLIEKRIRIQDPELYKKTRELLTDQLKWVENNLPQEKVEILKKTKIWIDYDSPGKSAMVYHPSREWLKNNGYNPDKTKSIEISHPKLFLDWITIQPQMVLHELAHSYHDRILGFENQSVKEAFNAAVSTKKYENVLHANGKKQRHYGLNNEMEFFAEMTETYFGKNDFYPFDRNELKEYDLKTFLWIEKEWMLR